MALYRITTLAIPPKDNASPSEIGVEPKRAKTNERRSQLVKLARWRRASVSEGGVAEVGKEDFIANSCLF